MGYLFDDPIDVDTDEDIEEIAGLTGTGLLARVGTNDWEQRTVTGTANKITVTNGNGVSGNPTLTIPDNPVFVGPSITSGQRTAGIIRAEGPIAVPTGASGAGAELFYDTDTSQAILQGWNRTSSAFVPVEIRGETLTIEPQIVDTVDFAPTANTYDRALNIVQTSPVGGSSVAGPRYFSNIDVVMRGPLSGTGLPGDPGSATVAALNISANAGGGYDGISAMAFSSGMNVTVACTATTDFNGGSTGVVVSASAVNANAYGGSAGATVTATGTVLGLFGHETNLFLFTGGVCPVRVGYHSMSWGETRASDTDAAFSAAMPGGGSGTEWGNAYTIGGTTTPFPLHSTASIMKSFTSGTITNGLKFDNITFTGDLLHFPNFRVTAAGVVTGGTYNGATINENAWTTYTPTLTSGGGTITTSTGAGRYRRLFGRTMQVAVRATLTTIGTATGALIITLPVNASTTIPAGILTGREVATTGKGVAGTIQSATTINCLFVDAASVFTGGNGTIVDAMITYETAS